MNLYYFFSLRPKHWIKNLFIFLPLVFSEHLLNPQAVIRSCVLYVSFCILASGIYLLNDLKDLEQDRNHPVKRLRPLPSGRASKKFHQGTGPLLVVMGLLMAYRLDEAAFGWCLVYFILNMVYMAFLKSMVIVDVMCLGAFFVLRVMAGASVVHVETSYWIVIMTGLLALFLGFNKRRHELKILGGEKASQHRGVLESYNLYFIDQMISVLTSSIVVFYTLYTVDARTVSVFDTRALILTVPFVYYGIFRYLYLVHKRGKGGDPTHIVLSDDKMILNLTLWISTSIAIIYFKAF